MKRASHCFALGFCLAAIAAAWGRNANLHAQLPGEPVCDCQNISNSFPQNLNCVGDMTEQTTCVANTGSATCTMSGTLWWTPTVPTCAHNSSAGASYEPPYLFCPHGMKEFNPTFEKDVPVFDTQPCPSPSDCNSSWPRVRMHVAYLVPGGGPCTSCGPTQAWFGARKVYNCVLP